MRKLNLLTILIFFALFLTACGASATQPTVPAPTDEPVAEADDAEHDADEGDDLSAEAVIGFELYTTVGCAACHGAEGQGSVGPALAGHTRDQVFRQVRTPKGDIMPAFSEDRLSDVDIENIVVWIDSLGSEMVMEHSEEGEADGEAPELSMTEADHLRLVLDSLAAENEADAIHHAQHLVEDAGPEVLPLAEKVLADLQAGNIHEVEAETGDVLGSLADEEFNAVAGHIGMALSAFQRDDMADVDHHLESAVLAAANHDHQSQMQQMLDDWRQGNDPHDVIDQMYAVLGLDHQD
jgi:mono/diheme cytochrome c family protein